MKRVCWVLCAAAMPLAAAARTPIAPYHDPAFIRTAEQRFEAPGPSEPAVSAPRGDLRGDIENNARSRMPAPPQTGRRPPR